MDNNSLYVLIAAILVVFASVAAWIESRLEKHDAPDYRRVLHSERRYREHVARGPVTERRRASRKHSRHTMFMRIAELVRGRPLEAPKPSQDSEHQRRAR